MNYLALCFMHGLIVLASLDLVHIRANVTISASPKKMIVMNFHFQEIECSIYARSAPPLPPLHAGQEQTIAESGDHAEVALRTVGASGQGFSTENMHTSRENK